MSTNNKGKLIIHKVSRRFTQGVKQLQERIKAIRNKANSTMDVNLLNKLKLDISSSNNELHENSINPMNNLIKNRFHLLNIKKGENPNYILEKEKTNKHYDFLVQNIKKKNSLDFCQGPNDIIDK